MNDSVKLIEVFRTWQGEGPDCGRSMLILRFKTCNLNCPWCDTKVKMRITPEASYPLDQLQTILDDSAGTLGLLITGGEPTADRHINDCTKLLNKLSYPIANVESNGYRLLELIDLVPQDAPIHFIYSPKIFLANDAYHAQQITPQLFMDERVTIKAVYEPQNEYMTGYLEWLSRRDQGQRVYLMPEGVTRADLIKNSSAVFDAAERYNFNFSSRDHIIYGFV